MKQPVAFYTLDVIISIGYRVKSLRGTRFRIWANKVLKDYLIKGYAVNDKITQKKYKELSQLVHILYNLDGSKRITNGALVALTLMIAESRPEEKDVMVKVVVNLINKDN